MPKLEDNTAGQYEADFKLRIGRTVLHPSLWCDAVGTWTFMFMVSTLDPKASSGWGIPWRGITVKWGDCIASVQVLWNPPQK